jgi:hypothetical protein
VAIMTTPAYDRTLDADTLDKGTDGPFQDWEGDHTALVHVLWHAKWDRLDLLDEAEVLADRIVRSRWLAAARAEDEINAELTAGRGPFAPEDASLTALAEVLRDCARERLNLADDFDAIASRIMRSRWMLAIRSGA